MENNITKTPFRDLVKTLKEIKEKPLSDEQIQNINSIVNENEDNFENVDPIKKIAISNEQTASY